MGNGNNRASSGGVGLEKAQHLRLELNPGLEPTSLDHNMIKRGRRL